MSCFQSHALCSSHYTAFSFVKWVPETTTNPKQSCNVGCADIRYNFSPRQQASPVCQGRLSLPTERKLYVAINWRINFFFFLTAWDDNLSVNISKSLMVQPKEEQNIYDLFLSIFWALMTNIFLFFQWT